MNLDQYIDNLNQRYKLGNATEHTFRGDLQTLIESLVPEIRATNEPKRQSCGAPDYILTKKDIPVGFIEAKDIGDKDLEGAKKTGNKEQFDRYKASLGNLIFTDYLSFLLYRDGQFVTKITIARLEFPSNGGVAESRGRQFPSLGGVSEGRGGHFTSLGGVFADRGGHIVPLPENFSVFENLLKDFCTHVGQTIKSNKKLAEMMAGKARLLSAVIEKALTNDEEKQEDSTLKDQMNAFKEILIHDITPKGFADVYAQTIAYGMFAARSHDPSLDSFSRQEAAELIPKSNPFLRKLFGYIAGPDIDDRIKWIVDNLVEIFLACNVEEILKNYGKSTKMEDPIIHFYETFLSEYDPKLRKARGVWYTPAPVVNFIVRAVDDILKTEFDLPQGLADISKTKIATPQYPITASKGVKFPSLGGVAESRGGIEVHRVQILDPATGTGTFLAEVVKLIHQKFAGQQGIWSNYVETHLLPRLNGFELLMASYAMAHLKLDLLLNETGYKPTPSFGHPSNGGEMTTPAYSHPSNGGEFSRGGNQRIRVYLTNSLEEHHPDTGTLFANWLSSEANEANHIKRDTPVMVVMGNPPYSGESANKGEWISTLMEDYKKEPGGKRKLQEKNSKWLNDDYCKFLRFAQHFVEKNSSGIVAFINPHGFLDAPTFRGMRWSLMSTFDKIFILDLHGNSRKKEVSEDGSADENVFDIIQGVSINIFVKTANKNSKLASVNHFDLYGKRQDKYDFVTQNSIGTIPWEKLPCVAPEYFFVNKDYSLKQEYEEGFSVAELIPLNGVGICSKRDSIAFKSDKKELNGILDDFIFLNELELKSKYHLHDSQDAKVNDAVNCVKEFGIKDKFIKLALYRPFDNKWTYYTERSHGFLARPAFFAQKHLLNETSNIGLCFVKAGRNVDNQNYFVTNRIITKDAISSLDSLNVFPLYLYPETNAQQTIETTLAPPKEGDRTPNLNPEIVKEIAKKLNLGFVPEKHSISLSPPLEGCPQDGVVDYLPKNGVVDSTCIEESSMQEVVNSFHLKGSAKREIVTTINNTPIKRNFVENLPYNQALSQRAKDKRKAGILSEVLFWQQVHQGKFHLIDFDRQRIIGNYIVDFYVKTLGLIIEIDGSSHDDKVEYDMKRQSYLESLGLKVYRIDDFDVKKNLDLVMLDLEKFIVKEYGERTTPSFGHPSKGEVITPAYNHPSDGGEMEFAPIDLLDYVYAVLHSPTYREKYKEFLKIDFPRVPYPRDTDTFWQLVKLGGAIRQIHLLESPVVETYITQYPIDGDNVVGKILFLNSPPWEGTAKQGVVGRVFINDIQYFDSVPETVWNFYIGGYQPAQKWLKDRKGRKLEFEDILHYQKIIVALSETDRLMKEIDKIEFE